MGPDGSLAAVYSILKLVRPHIYILGCGLVKIVSKHFEMGPSKLTLFGLFKWIGLIGLIY